MEISPNQWERVKELYEGALECIPSERTAFLRKNADDEIVRKEVYRLLTEHDDLGSFLSTPAFLDPRLNPPCSSERLAPDEVLGGRFRIISFLAAGGMGEVYKAQDQRLDRIVVLKFLPKELAEDTQSLERFRSEAKAASGLNHPNICTVYDFGEETGQTFIAMEYLDGEILSERIRKGPLPLEEALKVAIAVGSALTAAHRRGIAHRDLKPGNIMLTNAGAKLLDFGLAKHEALRSADEHAETAVITGDEQIVGTLPYMSPERLRGKGSGIAGDIFAFGAVLYEMIAGRRAFERRSGSDTIAVVDGQQPKPLREFMKDVPHDLERIIRQCLRERPEERYASMSEVERDLEDCALASGVTGRINLRSLFLQCQQPKVAILVLLILVGLVGVSAWWIDRAARIKWARDEAVPQIARLIEKQQFGEAYALAVQAEPYIPRDPALTKYWPDISWSGSINTTPSGASVYRKNYKASENDWELVGLTPIKNRRFADVDSKWKFELKGYDTVERATFPADESMTVTMSEVGKAPVGMVRVELVASASESTPVRPYGLPGLDPLPAVPMNNFWIDKFEVTNSEFKRFVDQGGYEKPEYWRHEFREGGHALSWAESMKLFRDKTGRPGPATWSEGEYQLGQKEYPVTGVSWFEAAAYAEFAGKQLPTIYHWTVSVSPTDGPSIIPASNFGGEGPAPVGTFRGMSWSGAYDMAGNVKEWVLNGTSTGKRYILGGAWNDPTYAFFEPDARSPFERSSNLGFRCAKYSVTSASFKATEPLTIQVPDYNSIKPVSDQLFQAYKSLFSYDKTPLNAVAETIERTDDWKEEKITFDAAYGHERVIAYLFLPTKGSPPYQTVVHFTGAAALHERSSENLRLGYLEEFDFIIKSGRAVMFPVYKGTFERWDNFKYRPRNTSTYRDHVIEWSKDLGRSVDYLETRPDIDHDKLAYEGISWGAAMGATLPAIEERLKALVLVCPGFYMQRSLPEVEQVNFASRVRAPVLMLNGRFDFYFPVGASQEPMFRLLGTRKEDKRRVLYDTGHDIPRTEMIKETLNWLDRYLGPVK